MTDKQKLKFIRIRNQYENQILELVENQLRNDAETLTQSDLQGAVGALVANIYNHR